MHISNAVTSTFSMNRENKMMPYRSCNHTVISSLWDIVKRCVTCRSHPYDCGLRPYCSRMGDPPGNFRSIAIYSILRHSSDLTFIRD